jgi:hypothetical protein
MITMMKYTPNAEQETEDIRLLLFVKFPNVFVGAHLAARYPGISSKFCQRLDERLYLLLEVVEQ